MSEDTLSRRQFVRIGAGVGAATAGIGTATSPAAAQNETDSEQSCDPEESLECSYGGEPDYGASYLIGRVKDHFPNLGGSENYEDKQAETISTQAQYDAQTISAANKTVLTTIENLLANARSVAYQLGRTAYLESLNEGAAPAEALTDGKTAISEYITPNRKNLIERWNQVGIQLEMIEQRIAETDGLSRSDVFFGKRKSSFGDDFTVKKASDAISFADGSTADEYYYLVTGTQDVAAFGDYRSYDAKYIGIKGSNGIVSFAFPDRFARLFEELGEVRSQAQSDLEAFSQGIADSYTAGEITTEELVSPRDLWSMSSEDAENPYAAADLAGLGLEVNQSSSVTIELLDDDVVLDGSVYISESPINESLSVGTVYDPTQSVETDSDGNPIDYAGTTDDPVPLDGLTYIAYNTDDGGSTYSQIQQPFKVVDAIGEDGKTLDEVGYEPSGGQQTTTTDIDKLREELQAMNDEINRLEEERREIAGGGGLFSGLGGDFSGQTVAGIIAVLIGLAALGRGG